MLQSPRFLYRIESEGSPDAYELASRLSYLVWGSPPDQELFNSAKNNLLHNPDQIHKQVTRMLKDPRAVHNPMTFISEWLNLRSPEKPAAKSERIPILETQTRRRHAT